MPIIDIDTHFEPGRSWLVDQPALTAQLPEYSVATATMRAQVGDLLAGVPVEDRPPVEDLLLPDDRDLALETTEHESVHSCPLSEART